MDLAERREDVALEGAQADRESVAPDAPAAPEVFEASTLVSQDVVGGIFVLQRETLSQRFVNDMTSGALLHVHAHGPGDGTDCL